MKVKEAIQKALNSEQATNLKSYFLSSCFFSVGNSIIDEPDEWTVHLYNPRTEKVVSIFVGNDIKAGEQSEATGPMTELLYSNLNIDFKEAAAKIKISKDVSQILVTLHMKAERIVWTFVLVGKNLLCRSIDIDAENGELVSDIMTSLLG